MEKDTSWGDGIMLSAAALCYQRPVKAVVYSNSIALSSDSPNTVITIGNESSDSHPIYLGYVDCCTTSGANLDISNLNNAASKGNHYVSLVALQETLTIVQQGLGGVRIYQRLPIFHEVRDT